MHLTMRELLCDSIQASFKRARIGSSREDRIVMRIARVDARMSSRDWEIRQNPECATKWKLVST